MSTKETIESDLTTALKARDAAATSTLRMLRAALKNAEIDKMKPLEEAEVVEIIGREVKKLRDGEASFTAGGREDLAIGVRAEIALLEKYLPAQLSDEELRAIVAAKKASMGELTPKDFGKLMAEVMKEAKGRADGGKVQSMVKEALGA